MSGPGLPPVSGFAPTVIAVSFPTPDLALRTNNKADHRRAHLFSIDLALAATYIADRIHRELQVVTAPWERVPILEAAHLAAVRRRYELACTAHRQRVHRLGTWSPDEYRVPLLATRYDRIGDLGRLRDGATWDEVAGTYVGGEPTPASVVMKRVLRLALDRWDRTGAGDRLANTWTTNAGEVLTGSQVLRGAAAADAAAELRARVAAGGGDVSRFDAGVDPDDRSPAAGLYCLATSDPDSRAHLHAIAVRRFAELLRHRHITDPAELRRGFDTAVWLLYQAPRTLKGSDAVTRVFAVAVGALLFDEPPILRQDVGLRARVLDLAHFLHAGGAVA